MAKLKPETIKKLVKSIANTRAEEVGCDICIDELAKFVEFELDGQDVSAMMPLIKHHLDSCSGCGEEYEALLDSLNSIGAAAV